MLFRSVTAALQSVTKAFNGSLPDLPVGQVPEVPNGHVPEIPPK